jgi:hypothetical protein
MELISDILLAAGAIGVAIYCYVLSSRLKVFSTLETGMGGAIAVLSSQVDDMTKALDQARGAATGSADQLSQMTERAEAAAVRLELLLASLHDLPEPTPKTSRQDPVEAEPPSEPKLRFVRRRMARSNIAEEVE